MWSDVVSSLNAVDLHALIKGNNLKVTKMKSIRSDPLIREGPSMDSPCFWYSGSKSLHALHTLAIPPDNDENVSLPSMVSVISWFCLCLLLGHR